jgi:hypothetical protein
MPPRRRATLPASVPVPVPTPILVSTGGGMVAGLELWRADGRFWLWDRSVDGRFAADVATWNSAAGSLNPATANLIKQHAPDAVSPTASTGPRS